MVREDKGSTLVEMLLALGLLSLLTVALFEAFDFGATAFRTATEKQESQGAYTRAYTALQKDLRQTHFRSTSVLQRELEVDDEFVRLDGLSLGSLKDWDDPASFDAINGLPKWDRYIIYYGTTTRRLVRSAVDPSLPDFSPAPLADFEADDYLNDDPEENRLAQTSYKFLSDNLKSFQVERDITTDTVSVRGIIEIARSRRTYHTEFQLQVVPQNTWPRGDS